MGKRRTRSSRYVTPMMLINSLTTQGPLNTLWCNTPWLLMGTKCSAGWMLMRLNRGGRSKERSGERPSAESPINVNPFDIERFDIELLLRLAALRYRSVRYRPARYRSASFSWCSSISNGSISNDTYRTKRRSISNS